MIVDRAVYRDGRRVEDIVEFDALSAACDSDGAVAWLGLFEPSADELGAVAQAFGLHELAVEDAVTAHQRPKLERYGDMLFIVLRPARYVDETETVLFGEVDIFVGPNFVITVRHRAAPDLGRVRRHLEARPELLQLGPVAIVYGILDHVVDGYAPVVAGLEKDLDEIEDEVFGGSATVSRRIYELAARGDRVPARRQAVAGAAEQLIDLPGVDEEERRYLRDVQDHALRVEEQVDGFRALLQSILGVHLTLETKALTEASVAQSVQVQRLSAWAAILFAPTLVGTVYGMNFEHMPELEWRLGYPLALAGMLAVALILYGVFRRKRWI